MLRGYQTWSAELLMQIKDDGNLHRGQRSPEVGLNDKQCSMATKLGQKSGRCKFRMMVTFIEVKGQ